jgi:riboflavin synthase
LQATTLNEYQPGRKVNLEVDLLARYLERLLFDEAFPARYGFSK